MKTHVVLDTSFLVATIDNSDALHTDAAFLFKKLVARKDDLRILVPPLVIYELIVTLRRKGVKAKTIEDIVIRFVNLAYVSVLSLSELSALKHANSVLNSLDVTKALRTQDFLIVCVGEEFEASIITFDKKLWQRCKPIYSDVYYCSDKGKMTDEWLECLQNIDGKAGKDITTIQYLPLQT